MTRIMVGIWRFFASVKLTIVLALLVCVVTAWGSIVVLGNREPYTAIDKEILMPWLITDGLEHLWLTYWIFILIFLIALFAVNSAVCTVDRLYSIYINKRPWQSILPQLVHIGFLIALLGHLVGSTYGFRTHENILMEGKPTAVPGTTDLFVRLEKVDVDHNRHGMMTALATTVTLLKGGEELLTETLRINGPLLYKGMAFYYENHGSFTEGLVLDVDGEEVEVAFGAGFELRGGEGFLLGRLYPDFGVDGDGNPYSRSEEYRNPYQEIVSYDGTRVFLNISRPGEGVKVAGMTISFKSYVSKSYAVVGINKDPGIWFIIIGSSVLVVGMVLLLFTRGERGELMRRQEEA